MTERMSAARYRASTRRTKRHKYNAKRVPACLDCGGQGVVGGKCHSCGSKNIQVFDSKAESLRFYDLKLSERAGGITGLVPQKRIPIHVAGQLVGHYVADFYYELPTGVPVLEDVKGGEATDTALSRFKRKCVAAEYGIEVAVIRTGSKRSGKN